MILEHIEKRYPATGGAVEVFEDLSLNLNDNEITVILGPSGCGKTTLLRMIAGSLAPDGGTISGRDCRDAVSFIFQEPRLLPWMRVHDNIALVLERKLPDESRRNAVIDHILAVVGLHDAADMYPEELSGGMRQRVSIARAFAYPSELILMDEPFQSLDLKLRLELIRRYSRLWEEDRRTTLMVTHDAREALMLADTIHLLSERPAQVISTFNVTVDRNERRLGSGTLTALEQEIYATMRL